MNDEPMTDAILESGGDSPQPDDAVMRWAKWVLALIALTMCNVPLIAMLSDVGFQDGYKFYLLLGICIAEVSIGGLWLSLGNVPLLVRLGFVIATIAMWSYAGDKHL